MSRLHSVEAVALRLAEAAFCWRETQYLMQYVRSVARAQAALAHHEEKTAAMTELEISLVSGRLYFEAPPPRTGPSFIWTVPLAQSRSSESTDTSVASQASTSREVTGSQKRRAHVLRVRRQGDWASIRVVFSDAVPKGDVQTLLGGRRTMPQARILQFRLHAGIARR